jgi:GT2 family glycosyltransferase
LSASGEVVQAVVVLYRVAPQESRALRGLLDALQQDAALAAAIRVLVYDNSPIAAEPPHGCTYVHDAQNGGVLAAYSGALAEAQLRGAAWLLLLDDDTQVTTEFVRAQLQMVYQLAARTSIGAVVPKLRSAGRVASPHGGMGWNQAPLDEAFNGEAPVGTTAFNSGALLRRTAVEAVGGFPAGYPLDFLDHAMFARLARAGYRVWVLPVTLEHAMTWEDPAREMSVERFANVLESELRFHREYGSWTTLLAFRLRCARRGWQYRDWPDKRYAEICWRVARG